MKATFWLYFLCLVVGCILTLFMVDSNTDTFAAPNSVLRLLSENPIYQYSKKLLNEHLFQIYEDSRPELDIKVLFIGVKKCGTTSLKAFASYHPDLLVNNRPHVCRPKPFKSYRPISYVLESAAATNRVAIIENNECFHNVKIFDILKRPDKLILLLCDPTLRAYSDYKHIVRTYSYNEPFEKLVPEAITFFLTNQERKDFGEFMSDYRYEGHLNYSIVSSGFYHLYLREYFERYKPEQILILSGSELKQKPHIVMNQLEDFLGVRRFFNRSNFVRSKVTGYYCVRRAPKLRPHCVGLNRDQSFPPPDQDTIDKLRGLYLPYNEKLFQMLNRTFPWI